LFYFCNHYFEDVKTSNSAKRWNSKQSTNFYEKIKNLLIFYLFKNTPKVFIDFLQFSLFPKHYLYEINTNFAQIRPVSKIL